MWEWNESRSLSYLTLWLVLYHLQYKSVTCKLFIENIQEIGVFTSLEDQNEKSQFSDKNPLLLNRHTGSIYAWCIFNNVNKIYRSFAAGAVENGVIFDGNNVKFMLMLQLST